MLATDFGYDLDISGGTGQSVESAIVINSSHPSDALRNELLVLRGLGRGRGVYWRSISTSTIDEDGRSILQRKIETKEFQKNEIITQTENYYFDRVNTSIFECRETAQYCVNIDHMLGTSFPYEISWLHFSDWVDYEPREPGAGYSLSYAAPGFNADAFVYPMKDSSSTHVAELNKAVSGITLVRGEDAVEHCWDVVEKGDYSFFIFIPKKDPKNLSWLVIISSNGYFVKLRMTHFDDLAIRDIAKSFMQELIDTVRTAPSATNSTH